MINSAGTKSSLLAALALIAFPLAGCSPDISPPHSGLVPDIIGPATINAESVGSYVFKARSVMGYPLTFGVNWGDNTKLPVANNVSPDKGLSASHAWAQPGAYAIAVTVTDGHGESGFATYNVQVNPAGTPVPQPPAP